MKIAALGAFYQDQLNTIQSLAQATGSLWVTEAQSVLTRAATLDSAQIDDFLHLLHEAQRLNKIFHAGLAQDAAFKQALIAEALPSWQNFTSPPVNDALIASLADKLYNCKAGSTDFGLVVLGDQARKIGPLLFNKCQADNIPFIIQIADANFHALVLNHATEDNIRAMAKNVIDSLTPVTKRMSASSGVPAKVIHADEAKDRLYTLETRPFSKKYSTGEIFYTGTSIPTLKDAEIDGIPYPDYIKLFFEMCDQPWAHIDIAQRLLIKEFNSASKVRITNNDGTDISMDITGFTFCNSLIAKNVPGSEAFSAMQRESLEGIVVAKGKFRHDNEIIENLTLKFEKGRLVEYSADKNVAAFEKAINLDEGARYVGELGIGTNPHLKRHVANGLLVEKIGGSFHLALGAAYKYTDYMGEPVHVDNGNESALHWDITTMLYGKEGRIYLDGNLIMDHGKFIDPQYDVLNRGWEAVPEQDRPDYWRDYYKNKPPAP